MERGEAKEIGGGGGAGVREAGLVGEVYLVGAGGVTSAAPPRPRLRLPGTGTYRGRAGVLGRRQQRLTDWGGPLLLHWSFYILVPQDGYIFVPF